MSQTDHPPASARDRRLRPLWRSLQIGGALVLFVSVNVLSCQHYFQRDFTEDQRLTLSSSTRNFLHSLDQTVHLVVAFRRSSPLYHYARELAETYRQAAKSRLQVHAFDPVREPNRAAELAQRFGVEFVGNSIIVVCGESQLTIAESNMAVFDESKSTPLLLARTGEEALSSAIYSVAITDPAQVYLLTGKGALPQTSGGTASATLQSILARQHGRLSELSLDSIETIPEDARALVLINPRYDLSEDELRLVHDWWREKAGALLLLLNPEYETPNLNAFARTFGISPQGNVVLRTVQSPVSGLTLDYEVAARFTPGIPWTASFRNTDTRFPGVSQSLEVFENDSTFLALKIRPTPLIESTEAFWGETRPTEEPVVLSPTLDEPGPVALAAMSELGGVEDGTLKVSTPRLVVVGNPHLLDPVPLIKPNYDFISSALNWAMKREELVGTTPEQSLLFTADIREEDRTFLNRLLLIFLPAGALLFALYVWRLRRE
ncbi:MAG: GldG family protein [Verrucomicrobiota bacterium]